MDKLKQYENKKLEKLKESKKIPNFNPGDTVKVHVKIIEKKRERTQAFEGICIGKKNAGINSSFIVRKISYGEGVERVFPLYSPNLAKIEIKTKGTVRRAKLYYLKNLSGRKSRISEDKTVKENVENASKKEQVNIDKTIVKNEKKEEKKEVNKKNLKEDKKEVKKEEIKK